MNRKSRRKTKSTQKDTALMYKKSDIECIKQEATDKALDSAFTLMMGLPIMALKEEYGFGKKRIEKFMDKVTELYSDFNNDCFALDEVIEVIEKESGYRLEVE